MTEARVDLTTRLDGVGVTVRQKQTLDRVSTVLCDGLGEQPAVVWAGFAGLCDEAGMLLLAGRLRMVAELVAEVNL